MDNFKVYIDLTVLSEDEERKIFAVSDSAKLSKRELDDMPFGMSNRYDRFFDIGISQNKEDKIFFHVTEIQGYGSWTLFAAELNEIPSESFISEMRKDIYDMRETRYENLVRFVKNTREKILNIKELKEILMFENEQKDSMKEELSNNIRIAIAETIDSFREKYEEKISTEMIEEVIERVERDF